MGWGFSDLTKFLNPTTALTAMNPVAMVGSALSSAGQIGSSIYANQSSARQAAKQRDWEEEMSSTAHQREVADLRAAGLNPILSGTGGMGASTPSGASATQSAPSFDLSSAFRNFSEAFKSIAETSNITDYMPDVYMSQSSANYGSAASARAQADLNYAISDYNRELIKYNESLKKLVDQQIISEGLRQKILNNDIQIGKAAVEDAKNQGEVSKSDFGYVMSVIDRFSKSAGTLIEQIGRGTGAIIRGSSKPVYNTIRLK